MERWRERGVLSMSLLTVIWIRGSLQQGSLGSILGPSEEYSIHVINADPNALGDIELLPLAGSYEHIQAREAREQEEKRYLDTSQISQDANSAFEFAMAIKERGGSEASHQVWKHLEMAAEMGHIQAKEMVAIENMLGSYKRFNLTSSQELFQLLKEKAHPSGQMGMAYLYNTGLASVPPSQPLALLNNMFAALGGNSFAQMALGYRYLYGINVESKCEQALHFYRKVASKVVDHVPVTGGASMQKIRLHEEWENPGVNTNMDDDLIQYYTFIADKGDTSAQVILGQLYLQGGRGLPQDRALALRYFKKAADGNSANAAAFLGKMYLEGSKEVPQDNETAYDYFKQAADAGNPMGQSGLGLIHLYGRGIDVDLKQAVKYFKLSADQSYVDGQAMMGIMLFRRTTSVFNLGGFYEIHSGEDGLGIERDLQKAVKMLNQASQSGSVLALFHLAEINAFGFGVARVCKTATELYKNVAERGRWGTMFMEAFNEYKKGYINSALVKYLFLAELGYEVAQSNVAFLLDKAEDSLFPKNETFQRAIVYWERAAAQGYHVARIKLGDYHYYGVGTEIDYEEALNNYRQAKQSHSAQALFNLGYMHQQGLGVKQDLHLAKRFYDRAAEIHTDAQTPVALALMGLGVIYGWHQFAGFFSNFTMRESLTEAVLESAVENWDLYLAAGLICMLLGVLMIMQRVSLELARQRARRRNAPQPQIPPHNQQAPPPVPQEPPAGPPPQ